MLIRLALNLVLCVCLAGCHPFCSSSNRASSRSAGATVTKEKIDYIGGLPATPAGEAVALVRMKAAKAQSQMVLFTGNLVFRGKIKPENAGEALPRTLRFELQKKSSRGAIQNNLPFNVNLEQDGTIKAQKFPFTNVLFINAKESLEVAIIPVDAALPASNATLKFIYSPTAGSQDEYFDVADDKEFDSLSAEVKRFALSYNGLLPPTPRQVEQGHFRFTAVTGLDSPPIGNLNVKGKFVSQDGRLLPTHVQLIVKFTTAKGKVLATERYDVRVESDGKVPLQKFPLNTTIAIGTQALQFSTMAIDRDFPLSSAQIKIFFTQS